LVIKDRKKKTICSDKLYFVKTNGFRFELKLSIKPI
jgi:hypothetical protein